MAVHRITRGLDLPMVGEPSTESIAAAVPAREAAIVAADYIEVRPRMLVAEGDTVKRGQPLCEERKIAGVVHTAPAAGTVKAINRGAKRALQSIVITLADNENAGGGDKSLQIDLPSHTGKSAELISGDEVKALMVQSGMWTALRTRPFDRVPSPEANAPSALFVTAIDTNPLAAKPEQVLQGREADLEVGLTALSKLTEGATYLCLCEGSSLSAGASGVRVEHFAGKHPAGLVGTHIHMLEGVNRNKAAWYIGYQDVAAIGHLVTTGELDMRRVASIAGPGVKEPRLQHTRVGAAIDALIGDGLGEGELRIVSGSVLSGRNAAGEAHAFLGRYDNQVSVLAENRERVFMGWAMPGFNIFSTITAFASKLVPGKRFAFTTATNGGPRAMVPIGMYERVMPLDVMPTFLLRALAAGDVERAEHLGALELGHEDLALCTFVCPGKTDWAAALRRNLTQIEKEGLCSF